MFEDENGRKLTEGLRAVAADSPHEAPPHVGLGLEVAFREHHSRRRRRRIAWTLAGLASVGMFLAVGGAYRMRSPVRGREPGRWRVPVPPLSTSTRPARELTPGAHSLRRSQGARKGKTTLGVKRVEKMTGFFPLPYSDNSLPLDNAVVIRVTLPRGALGLAGLPLAEEREAESVQADLVLGEDGLACAVRFVM